MQKILVVEDEQMLAKIIGMKLEEEKFEVIHAYDGQAAYEEMSKSQLPDLVLLDLLLPRMSGFEVLEKLKSENKPLPKVIVFSNFAQKADVEKAHELGAIDYIVKAAFSPSEILSKIKAIFAAGNDSNFSGGLTSSPSGSDNLDSSNSSSSVDLASSEPEGSLKDDPYAGFESLQDVTPMSEVLRPGEPNNNP
jgi:DNA-binding response OmpR family regulator